MEFYHHGIKDQRWGIRRYQYEDGTLTPEGRKRYLYRNRIVANRKTTSDVNKIVRSLSDEQKRLLGDTFDKDYIEDELKSYPVLAKRIIQKEGNTPVSFIEVWDNEDRTGSIVTATNRKYQGKGYGSKNVKDIKKWIDKYGKTYFDTIYWDAYDENIGSQKLAEKAGFKKSKKRKWEDMARYQYDLK